MWRYDDSPPDTGTTRTLPKSRPMPSSSNTVVMNAACDSSAGNVTKITSPDTLCTRRGPSASPGGSTANGGWVGAAQRQRGRGVQDACIEVEHAVTLLEG